MSVLPCSLTPIHSSHFAAAAGGGRKEKDEEELAAETVLHATCKFEKGNYSAASRTQGNNRLQTFFLSIFVPSSFWLVHVRFQSGSILWRDLCGNESNASAAFAATWVFQLKKKKKSAAGCCSQRISCSLLLKRLLAADIASAYLDMCGSSRLR
jgi:hypothetical protein